MSDSTPTTPAMPTTPAAPAVLCTPLAPAGPTTSGPRLTRASFRRLTPFSRPRPMSVLPARRWTSREWERISLGRKAASMDEKWNVFAEDGTLHVHRSWTGRQAFEATFTQDGDGWRITAALAEAAPERVRVSGAEWDAVMLELVVSAIVLGEDVPELWDRWTQLTRRSRRSVGASA